MHRGPEIASQRLRGALEAPIGPNPVLSPADGPSQFAVDASGSLSAALGAPKEGARLACLAPPLPRIDVDGTRSAVPV
jgi:hypothetical protein